MRRRDFVSTCLAGAGGVALGNLSPGGRTGSPPIGSTAAGMIPPAGGRQGSRPNVLWLLAEDLSPDLGCYGEGLVHTPNIDRLAAEGMRFANAFATAPVCSATRSAFMTGMYQTSFGAHQHRTDPKHPLPRGVELITEHFRRAGYFTTNCNHGRWERGGKTDFNFTVESPFDGTDWRQRAPGQPFFSIVNFSETHRTFARDPDRPVDPEAVELPPYYPDHPLTRRDWADYLECAQVLDRKVGEVIRRLEEDGVAENTIVVFFGDHGRAHVRGKQFLYEGGIRIPLIVQWPGTVEAGSVSDGLVSAIDLAPTCLSLVGVEPPDHLHGKPLLDPQGRNVGVGRPSAPGSEAMGHLRIFAARDRCDETYDGIRCVRDRRFKYIRNLYPNLPYTQTNLYKLRQYPVLTLMQVLHARGELTEEQARFMAPARPSEELYDLERDPHELHNLADDPTHRERLESMRSNLDGWMEETGDMGRTPEDPRVAARVYLERHLPNHRRVMEGRGLPPEPSPEEYLSWWEGQLLTR